MTFGAEQARAWVRVPDAADDKYRRGVLGMATGSERFPGAAVLGVEAAVRTGVGMVRYLGTERAAGLVLARRPEIVTTPGRVQAWVLGSGQVALERTSALRNTLETALSDGVPVVLDAGALDLARRLQGPGIITPHAGELRAVLEALGEHEVARADIEADPERWAAATSDRLDVVVLLKGARTVVAGGGEIVRVDNGTHWMATAGTGDVLAGVVGALLATHADAVAAHELVRIAATAAWLHAEAGRAASAGGPIAALDVAEALPRVVAQLVG